DAICAAAARSDVRRIVAFGSFATYDNRAETITEQSNGCPARIPYVVGKEQLERAFSRGLKNHPSLTLALLQPSIVVGAGGSWDRFARKLTCTERIYLPAGGEGICNVVDVDVVAEAVCRSLELPATAFGPSRAVKALISGRQATTWAQWLNQAYGIPASRISACNTNAWSEDTKRNLMLSIRFSSVGASLFEMLKGRPAAEPTRRPSAQRTESSPVPVPVPLYVPEGLDRLTLSCRSVVDPGRALALGLLD
ncbi:hypothetical protein, partial [Massilia sp. MS-15]|uniref:hypothetical protein n=1 Tax=Massilia sp. MS-15 TaxID=2878200 RepID=UPI001CD22B43